MIKKYLLILMHLAFGERGAEDGGEYNNGEIALFCFTIAIIFFVLWVGKDYL